MKIRSSFVSNSSSCSFIVSLDHFTNTFDLAKYMIKERENSETKYYLEEIKIIKKANDIDRHDEHCIEDYNKSIENLKAITEILLNNLEELKKENDINSNLLFKSCNYDTFISKQSLEGKSFLYVATCNNVPWNLPKPNFVLDMENDIWDGNMDDNFIIGDNYLVIDTKKSIIIKDVFRGAEQ